MASYGRRRRRTRSKRRGRKVTFLTSDGKRVSRPYNPNSDMQYEFVAKSTGNLCKRYWDAEKGDWRTAIMEKIVSIKPIKRRSKKKGK